MKLKPGIKKALIIILIVLLVAVLSFGGYQVYKLINNTTKSTTVKVVDKIDAETLDKLTVEVINNYEE